MRQLGLSRSAFVQPLIQRTSAGNSSAHRDESSRTMMTVLIAGALLGALALSLLLVEGAGHTLRTAASIGLWIPAACASDALRAMFFRDGQIRLILMLDGGLLVLLVGTGPIVIGLGSAMACLTAWGLCTVLWVAVALTIACRNGMLGRPRVLRPLSPGSLGAWLSAEVVIYSAVALGCSLCRAPPGRRRSRRAAGSSSNLLTDLPASSRTIRRRPSAGGTGRGHHNATTVGPKSGSSAAWQ